MDIAPIKTRRDYRHALKRIDRFDEAKRGTSEGDYLDVLVTNQIPYGSERISAARSNSLHWQPQSRP